MLPNGWTSVLIGEVLTLINGRGFKQSEWRSSGLPIVRIKNLNNPEAPFNYYQGDLPEKFMLDSGDLLLAWSGTPGTSFGAHMWQGGKAWLNQHIFKVEFDDEVFDKRYLRLAINKNLNEYIRSAHGGAGLAHITKGKFEASELILPPRPEQQRIVAEIEKQFTRLDAGVAGLKRAQANLKRYRAAVLTAACEGKLVPTEAELAGAQGRTYQTGKQLLQQILKQRHTTWDQQNQTAQRKKKYTEPKAPDTSELPKLPRGWVWAYLDQLGSELLISAEINMGPRSQGIHV